MKATTLRDLKGSQFKNRLQRFLMLLTINPIVSVPVLSEHKTDIQPKVSIVARFLTRTLRFAIRFAMIVSDNATQTGRP